MRKLLSIIGVCGLLISILALAGMPAGAATTGFTAVNEGAGPLDIVASSACSTEEATVAGGSQRVLNLDTGCNYTVTATDAAGLCVVRGRATAEDDLSKAGYRVAVDVDAAGAVPDSWRFKTSNQCVDPDAVIEIDKDVESDLDEFAAAQTTFTFVITPYDLAKSAAQADGGLCSDQSTHSGKGDTDGAGWIAQVDVVNGFIAGNEIDYCSYSVTEVVPKGWTLTEVDSDEECDEQGIELLDQATVILTPTFTGGEEDACEAEFTNDLNPLPLSVTKTFVGRDFYTTVDRADFHLFTPGSCGSFAIDPFGGLLGSVGLFRTVNASQRSQIVVALPDIQAAGPNGACTYRVQENDAPEGCTALEPDGSDADGPYWEQTWVPGETENFVFNIVNDCSRPGPTPDPTTPPADPDKKGPGAKKPGGDLNPKFTG